MDGIITVVDAKHVQIHLDDQKQVSIHRLLLWRFSYDRGER